MVSVVNGVRCQPKKKRTDVKRRSLFSGNDETFASLLLLSSEVARSRWAGYRISLCACVCVSDSEIHVRGRYLLMSLP